MRVTASCLVSHYLVSGFLLHTIYTQHSERSSLLFSDPVTGDDKKGGTLYSTTYSQCHYWMRDVHSDVQDEEA